MLPPSLFLLEVFTCVAMAAETRPVAQTHYGHTYLKRWSNSSSHITAVERLFVMKVGQWPALTPSLRNEPVELVMERLSELIIIVSPAPSYTWKIFLNSWWCDLNIHLGKPARLRLLWL